MKAATAVRCAKELVAEVTRNFPALKEHIARKEYEEAYLLLLRPRAEYHYDAGGDQGLNSLYMGPSFSTDFRLLMEALREKEIGLITYHIRCLETTLRQRAMRQQTLGEKCEE